MLSFNALMRFALSRSPFREQREILFVKKDEHQSDPEAERKITPRREDSSVDTEGTRRQVSDVLATIDYQEIADAAKEYWGEAETFEHLLESEETLASVNLGEAAERAGVLPFPQESDIRVDRRDSRSVLEGITRYDREYGLTAERRKRLMEILIERSPRVTAALLRAMTHRLERPNELMGYVHKYQQHLAPDQIMPAYQLAEEKEWHGGREDILGKATEDESERLLGQTAGGLKSSQRRPQVSSDERPLLEEARRNPRALDRLASDPRAGEGIRQLQGLRGMVQNIGKHLQNLRMFGARFWGTEDASNRTEDERRQQEYIRHIQEQTKKLTSLLALQVQLQGLGARNRLRDALKGIGQRNPGVHEDYLLKSQGRLEVRSATVITGAEHVREIMDRASPGDSEYLATMQDALDKLELLLPKAERLEEEIGGKVQEWGAEPLGAEEKEQRENEEFVARCKQMIPVVLGDSSLSKKRRRELELLLSSLDDPRVIASFDEEMRSDTEEVLTILRDHGEAPTLREEREKQRMVKPVQEALRTKGAEGWGADRRKEIDASEQEIRSLLTHPICQEYSVSEKLHDEAAALRGKIAFAVKGHDGKDLNDPQWQDILTECAMRVRRMQRAAENLRKLADQTSDNAAEHGSPEVILLSPEEYRQQPFDETSNACFYKGKIYLKVVPPTDESTPALELEKRKKRLRHEVAHATLWVLSEQSHLFDDLVNRSAGELSTEKIELLKGQAGRWGVSRDLIRKQLEKENEKHPLSPELLEARVEARFKRELLEEATVRRSVATEEGEALSEEDQAVFDALAKSKKPEQPHVSIAEMEEDMRRSEQEEDEESEEAAGVARHITEEEREERRRRRREMGEPEEEGGEGSEEGGERIEGAYDPTEDLDDIESKMLEIKTFGDVYTQYQSEVNRVLNGENGYRANLKCFREVYATGKTTLPDGRKIDLENPQADEELMNQLKDFQKHVQKTADAAAELDWKLSDVNEAKGGIKAGSSKINEMLGIRWLCILDLLRMWKELKEDINTMWKTDQDKHTSEAMAAWSKNLPVKIFGQKIPIVGKYTERLPHYTERRRNQLELDRVKKWEDSFKNEGAEEILEYIGNDPTKDQLRACIELLVGKGRMRWGDKRVWKALNKFSKFTIPEGPCSRNELLRDKWLHKLISDIWRDKDMFDEWRSQNDANFEKYKKSFTDTADNYANVSGHTKNELSHILKLYVKHKKSGEPMPEEVNPHHYEEMLHYSMRNGKMSMEQKMYYLIAGVAFGLLDIARLRVLAGQKGDLLMKFPFLDYFYQRHNSIHEVQNLCLRVVELTDGGRNTFLPGPKMTIFLRLILLRDKKARERMSKALDRVAESLDHEDIPYLATEQNWSAMRGLMGVISGDRPKVTKQGWKNAYVGFNEKLKMYAYLAKMSKVTGSPSLFKQSDIDDFAEMMGSYAVMDNQMMRATTVGMNRPTLAPADLAETPVGAGNGKKTSEFREKTRDFASMLSERVNWGNKENFLATTERDKIEFGKTDQEKMWDRTSFLATDFIKTIKSAGREQIRDLLIEYQESRGFYDGGSGGDMSFEEFRGYYPSVTTPGLLENLGQFEQKLEK